MGGARATLSSLLLALDCPPSAALELGRHAVPDVIKVGRRHRVTPLLSVLCKGSLLPLLEDASRRDRLITSARNLVIAHTAGECVRALRRESIPVIVLKGLAYEGRIYPEAGCRPTGDADLLVPLEARQAAFTVLDRLGFSPRAASPGFDEVDYHEVAWVRGEVEVDLHLALAPLVRCGIDYQAVWRDAEGGRVGGEPVKILAGPHAAVFHALHMAIDHFDVPALSILDFARLVPSHAELVRAEAVARAWRCSRPFTTAAALTAAMLPAWRTRVRVDPVPWFAREVIARYGAPERVPRLLQLVRKVTHFDTSGDVRRYLVTQGRRKLREVFEMRVRRRSPRERLHLGPES